MFKYTSHKLSIFVKCLLLLASFCFGNYIFLSYIYKSLPTFIEKEYEISINMQLLIQSIPLNIILISIIPFLIFFILLTLDTYFFSKQINRTIKESLEDRKLSENFDNLYTSLSFYELTKNLKNIFTLFKSFDNMKTARIVLESSTIKQIMNSVNEGLILVSKDMIVTHINHVAEQHLGLIPGEIISQAISRKINNDIFLEVIEKSFKFNTKSLDVDINEDNLLVSFYPLKDKFGDIIRTLVVLKIKEEKQEESPTKKTEKGS